jgi:hypothetical protein
METKRGAAVAALALIAACGGSPAPSEPSNDAVADGSADGSAGQASGTDASTEASDAPYGCTDSLEVVRTYGGVECPNRYETAFACVHVPGQTGSGRLKVCGQSKVVVVTGGGYFLKGCVYDDTEKLVRAYLGASANEFCNRTSSYMESAPGPDLSPDALPDCSYCTFMGQGCEGYEEIPCAVGDAGSDADASGP